MVLSLTGEKFVAPDALCAVPDLLAAAAAGDDKRAGGAFVIMAYSFVACYQGDRLMRVIVTHMLALVVC